jgi:Ca2+-binding EF-hand superfamily protein
MLPRLMRERFTPSEIQQLFKAADANGDGSVSVNEFLCAKSGFQPAPLTLRSSPEP